MPFKSAWNTYLVKHLPSKQIYKDRKSLFLLKAWATLLQCLKTCENIQFWRHEAMYLTSSAMWPNWAKEWLLLWSALMRIVESLSRITRFTLSQLQTQELFLQQVSPPLILLQVMVFAVKVKPKPAQLHCVWQLQFQLGFLAKECTIKIYFDIILVWGSPTWS